MQNSAQPRVQVSRFMQSSTVQDCTGYSTNSLAYKSYIAIMAYNPYIECNFINQNPILIVFPNWLSQLYHLKHIDFSSNVKYSKTTLMKGTTKVHMMNCFTFLYWSHISIHQQALTKPNHFNQRFSSKICKNN